MSERPILNDTKLGIVLITGSVFLLSVSDALVKLSNANFSMWQLYVARSLIAIPLLLLWIRYHQNPSWATAFSCNRWVLARSLALTLMWMAFYASLPYISLSLAALAIYTTPLFIALFTALALDEPVGGKRWLAVVLGFAGVLVILRPGGSEFSAVMLLPILAAVLYAVAAVLTRSKCASQKPLLMALNLNLCLLLVGAAALLCYRLIGSTDDSSPSTFLSARWVTMQPHDWLLMAFLALLMVLVSTGVAKAYQVGPSTVIGAFDYAYLVFAVFWGFALFNEVPDAATVLGMCLIALSGVLVLR